MNHNSITLFVHRIAEQLKPLNLSKVICTQYAWWIIESITKQSAAELLTQKCIDLSPEQKKLLQRWINLLVIDQMPLAYVLGTVSFAELQIMVRPPVLIPRPETEEWVLFLIEKIKKSGCTDITIFDIATGSGCIALACAKALPNAKVIATDISQQALNLAQENATINNISNITFIQSDLFENLSAYKADIIVSNPPYISGKDWESLNPSVKEWEDFHALVAHKNGYAFIELLAQQAREFLKNENLLIKQMVQSLWIEIGHQQGNHSRAIFEQYGYQNITLFTDLSGKDRVIIASPSS